MEKGAREAGAGDAEPLLAATRAHLLGKRPDRARTAFLRLPELETRRQTFLEAALRDFYAAGLYDVPVLLTFLESLPSWHWTLDGCAVLHRVSSSLRAPDSEVGGGGDALRALEARQRQFPQLPLAFFLHKLMSHLEGSARVRAESYWYAWVSPTLRAVVTGQPLELRAMARSVGKGEQHADPSKEELLYAPGNAGTFDGDRRHALCWVGDGASDNHTAAWPDEKDRSKAQWRLIPADAHSDSFLVQSVRFEEFLYAADYAKFKRDASGKSRCRVFTWRKARESPGSAGKWQLVALNQGPERDVFALYNPYQREFLYAPTADVLDSKRRHVLTRAPPDGAREASDKEGGAMWCAWRVAPGQQSAMERGVEAFFAKQYPLAVEMLTQALEDMPDNTEHVKCFAYRMTANLRLRRFELVAPDFQAIQSLGGDKAAIFHGLAHLWEENASYLAAMVASSPGQRAQVEELQLQIETSTDNPFFMRHQLSRGDDFFVRRDYQAAVVCYQEAATCSTTSFSDTCGMNGEANTTLEDPETTRQRSRAYVSCAKCFYALEEVENSWQYLCIAHEIVGISVESEATILLWKGKCRRVQKDYNDALALLEKAFDRASSASAASLASPTSLSSVSGSCTRVSAAGLKRSILMEMKVVGLLRQGVYNTLLAGSGPNTADTTEDTSDDSARSAEKTLQQMMELFHCPLSLELMDDPVTTPDGNTYERSMIEQHLEVNGRFDPLTRAPLSKAQLHPNRALKQLMETLLSDHRLGLLLASCST